MPVHDWTRIYAGAFHDFHHSWLEEIKRALNRGLLQPDYYALVDQIAGGLGPDVLALHRPVPKIPSDAPRAGGNLDSVPSGAHGGTRVAERPPRTQFHVKNEARWYAGKGKAVTVRHVSTHEVVAVVEIVSIGNKNSRNGIDAFVRKARELLTTGVHLTVVDVFPPGPRDPHGIHPLIWGEDANDEFRFDPAKPLTCAAYIGGLGAEAYVASFAVGDALPDTPLFLTPDAYVDIPLEATYQSAFAEEPPAVREVIEAPPTR
ncbi:MAG TPA: DUF4058 family protein [Gemmataceae bacterium]|nr:DUF4058 family protein [Gemmataceae bacterium]